MARSGGDGSRQPAADAADGRQPGRGRHGRGARRVQELRVHARRAPGGCSHGGGGRGGPPGLRARRAAAGQWLGHQAAHRTVRANGVRAAGARRHGAWGSGGPWARGGGAPGAARGRGLSVPAQCWRVLLCYNGHGWANKGGGGLRLTAHGILSCSTDSEEDGDRRIKSPRLEPPDSHDSPPR